MRPARYVAKGALLLALPALAPACAPDASGQLMLAVQTDMSLPKDVDAIRIEVFNEGVPKFRKDYERLGTTDGEIRLPGTLALIAPEKADSAVMVNVSARIGGPNGKIRVVRQVVTTVPSDRVASLQIPLRFVCDGSGEDENGEAKSTCPEGQTCIAGSCQDRTIDSSTLPDYEEDDVFAGGHCFDAATCWDVPTPADVDPSDCTIAGASNVNVGLAVGGDGICGPSGCFVTLDANSDEGWQTKDDGRIALPPAICTKLASGEIASVVTAPVTASCSLKTLGLPTCGPWSAAEHNPPVYEGPRALAGGQQRPLAMTLAAGKLFFTNSTSDDEGGSIKSVALEGGKVTSIPIEDIAAPRDLVALGEKLFFTSSPGTPEGGAIFEVSSGVATAIHTKLGAPEGLAVRGSKLFWADFQSGEVFHAKVGEPGHVKLAHFPEGYPYRMAADDGHLYVVNEGNAKNADGALVRIAHTGSETAVNVLVDGLRTPRALALELGQDGRAKAVYFATFSEEGTIERLLLSGEPQHEILATGLDHPNGIALDADTVYWTNWGDGTVNSISKTAKPSDAPTVLARGRVAPSAIFVDESAIYWVDEGSSSKPTGNLIKLPKPTP